MMGWDWSIDGWIVAVGILSACSCALVGNYLVLRKLSLMGDAISHAVLPGLAIAFILTGSRATWPMFVGAVVAGALTALFTQWITHYGKVEHGAAMGVVFSILFAIGLVLIRRAADHVDIDPGCVLYGNIALVPLDVTEDSLPPVVTRLIFTLLLNVLFIGLFYKELKIAAFDPDLATAVGINASVMHYALMVMVAITTVANFEAVGSILVIAMLIVPGVTAHLWTDRLGVMIGISLGIAMVSGVLGHIFAAFGPHWVGFSGSLNSAGMMTVVAGAMLFISILVSPSNGLIARAYFRLALATQIIRQDILGLLYRWHELRADRSASMAVEDVMSAVGGRWQARWALALLQWRAEIVQTRAKDGRRCLRLTDLGLERASQLVGSHRLWESYLAKHFELAADHLHAPAERMEHYITEDLRDELRDQLTDPPYDPHGRPIPPPKQGS